MLMWSVAAVAALFISREGPAALTGEGGWVHPCSSRLSNVFEWATFILGGRSVIVESCKMYLISKLFWAIAFGFPSFLINANFFILCCNKGNIVSRHISNYCVLVTCNFSWNQNSDIFVTLQCKLHQPYFVTSLFISHGIKRHLLFIGDGVLLVWNFFLRKWALQNFFLLKWNWILAKVSSKWNVFFPSYHYLYCLSGNFVGCISSIENSVLY